MKFLLQKRLLLLLVISLSFQQCGDKCKVTNSYIYYRPVYSTSAEVKSMVRVEPPHELKNIGKIYFKDNYLFIGETGEGIHVIDNKNPSAPIMKSFIRVPGSHDLSIAGNSLYVDSYVDLVVFDISDKGSIKEVNRLENVFNHTFIFGFAAITEKKMILTSWEKVSTVYIEESECENDREPWGGLLYYDGIALSSSAPMTSPSKTTSTGIAGSTSRFTISQNKLYALDGYRMDVINVASSASPVALGEIDVSGDAETLFPYKDKLFMGSRSGMYIYDLTTPETPALMSKYEHLRSCDPVVVDDKYAYVTLRSGNTCAGFMNQLEVIDISNLNSPQLLKQYQMTNPYGLGIDKDLLFICDGTAGLKIFDKKDVMSINTHVVALYPGMEAVDIIPYQSVAMMIATDALYQYDYSDPTNIVQLSKLSIERN